jgi:hypothetical protein
MDNDIAGMISVGTIFGFIIVCCIVYYYYYVNDNKITGGKRFFKNYKKKL